MEPYRGIGWIMLNYGNQLSILLKKAFMMALPSIVLLMALLSRVVIQKVTEPVALIKRSKENSPPMGSKIPFPIPEEQFPWLAILMI